jgi:hypothetical protein
MTREQHLGAVFEDQRSAESAVAELRRIGLGDEHLGVAVHTRDGYVFEEDVETQVAHRLEKGIAIGAPIGAVAGMTVLALAVPGAGTLGVGGILAAGGLSGALAGTFLGAYLGLSSEEEVLEEEWDWERLPLQQGQMLVVVSGHGHPTEVTEVLRRHGGHIVTKPRHVE